MGRGKPRLDCFSVECTPKRKSYYIHMITEFGDDLSLLCEKKGQKVTNRFETNMILTCGDPSIICWNQTSCPKDCNHR